MRVLGEATIAGVHVLAAVGDLTTADVDVVVNAANDHLRHGGGLAGALSHAGGPEIQAESDAWIEEFGPLAVGQAAVTGGGHLPARWVVHVAGPVYGHGRPDDESHLRAAVRGALAAATELAAADVALPALSAGIFGYPPDDATRIIADEVARLARAGSVGPGTVWLVGTDDATAGRFAAGLEAATA